MTSWMEPCLICRWLVTSILTISVWTHSMFSSVVDVDGCPRCSESFFNFSIHSYTLHFSKVLFPHHAKSVRFPLLVHLQPTEIGSLHSALLWSGSHINITTLTQLTVQDQNCNIVTKCAYTYSCVHN
jgi:hypothetical protein